MKFQIIDKDKRGFARYCPTFARGREAMREGLRKINSSKKMKKIVKEIMEWENLSNETKSALRVLVEGYDTKMMSKVLKVVNEGDEQLRVCVIAILRASAEKKIKIAIALPALKKALKDENECVRGEAAFALEIAAKNGEDISLVLPELAMALKDESMSVQSAAIKALNHAATNGIDIAEAIPIITKFLDGKEILYWKSVIGTLEISSTKYPKSRILFINWIIRFLHSDSFQTEMEKNSVAFEKMSTGIAEVLGRIKEAEQKEAA